MWAQWLRGCPRWDSNPHSNPFKGLASADWATGAAGEPTARASGADLPLRRRDPLELGLRLVDLPQRHDLAAEDQRAGPVEHDPDPPVPGGHAAHVVGAVHEPRDDAAQLHPVDLRDALVQPEAGHRARVAVLVLLQRTLAQVRDHVVG